MISVTNPDRNSVFLGETYNFFEFDGGAEASSFRAPKIAIAYVYITRQNVIMTLVDLKTRKGWVDTVKRKRGFVVRTIGCVSSGQCGFRGKRKTAPFAVNLTTKKLMKMVTDLGYTHLRLVFKGNGSNRETILKTFIGSKYKRQRIPILSVTDVTLSPHNGCRPKNRKRR